jgi:hypothetical protein
MGMTDQFDIGFFMKRARASARNCSATPIFMPINWRG